LGTNNERTADVLETVIVVPFGALLCIVALKPVVEVSSVKDLMSCLITSGDKMLGAVTSNWTSIAALDWAAISTPKRRRIVVAVSMALVIVTLISAMPTVLSISETRRRIAKTKVLCI